LTIFPIVRPDGRSRRQRITLSGNFTSKRRNTMSNPENKRSTAFAAWAGTTAIMAGQAKAIHHFGGSQAFQTGVLGFGKQAVRNAFASAPWQLKAATAVAIAAGWAAKRPLQARKHATEYAREKADEHWKK
jgi:hypothetical protein